MIRKIMLLILIFLGLTGCAAIRNFYNSPTPGLLPLPEGGAVQLFYSNSNFDDDPSVTVPHYFANTGEPTVKGGIGAMGVWHY